MSAQRQEQEETRWELVHDDYEDACLTTRMKVIGGWIVKVTQWNGESTMAMSTVFVPDPNHDWKI